MSEGKRRTALVTGASAGLGACFARQLAARGHDLVLTARREQRLQALADELAQQHQVQSLVIPADLSRPAAPQELADAVATAGVEVDLLVNNAGFAVGGRFLHVDWSEHATFLQVMMTAVMHTTYLLLPGMIERGYGRIINVASLAGLLPGSAGHSLYGAVKAMLITMTESFALELQGTGVNTTVTCPGFTYTEFHDVLGNREQVSKLPKYMWMEAEPVVSGALDAVERGQVLHIPGTFNRGVALLAKLLPHSLLLHLIARRSSRFRKQQA